MFLLSLSLLYLNPADRLAFAEEFGVVLDAAIDLADG
jgi:hypothetical protein